MAKGSLRRFDVQAKWSVVVSSLAAVCFLGQAGLIVRNYEPELRVIQFGAKGMFQPLFLGVCAVTMLLSFVGLVLGFNSAGQRRNEHQQRSWIGFFLGAATLALSMIAFATFYLLKMKRIT